MAVIATIIAVGTWISTEWTALNTALLRTDEARFAEHKQFRRGYRVHVATSARIGWHFAFGEPAGTRPYVIGRRHPIMIVPMSAPAIDGAKGMRLRLSSRT